MLAVLLADCIIWYKVWAVHKFDKAQGPYSENPLFDHDLDELWKASTSWTMCPRGLCETPSSQYNPMMTCKGCKENEDDIVIKQSFETWLKQESQKDKTLEDYLWEEGYLNPQEVIWSEGVPLTPGDPKDFKEFLKIKNKAYLEGTYNSKLLEEGGEEDLYKTWFMLKGCSDFGAEQLLLQGIKPWEIDFDL